MKQKPDETLDQWVHQTLGQLPDTPPPDSSFDSERLWAQLRPELQAAPGRRKIRMAWWIAAACLTGLTLSWFWLHQPATDQKTVVAYKVDRKGDVPTIASRPNPALAAEAVKPTTAFIEKNRPLPGLKIRSHQKTNHTQESAPLRSESVKAEPQATELPVVAEVSPIVEQSLERGKPSVAMTAPKRRFRVVHENELQAEEEARPKLYRSEHFVRIGTGERSEPVPDEAHQALTLPLTHKPNQ